MDAVNSGDADRVVHLVSQSGTAGPETQTVTMSAEDLGLPSGGTVILTVTGRGVNFSDAAGADANGMVSFEVPMIETNSMVTIELSVLDSNGNVIFKGSDTQQLNSTGNLSIDLYRQFWTLPSSLTVAVSPSAIAYNDTAPDSTSVTFSITNLTGAPDDAVFTYSWKDETGAEVGTGASLTRTAGQMLGAGFTPLNDSETRTYSVEVTYTDATGSTVTSSGSGTATIATAATLSVEGTGIQPGATEDRLILVMNKGTSVNLTESVLCYGGTVSYTWSGLPGGTGGVTLTTPGGDPFDVANLEATAGGTATVTAEATLADGRTLTKVIDVYVLELTLSEGGTPLGSADPVVLIDKAGDSASLTASLTGLSGLSGVSYSWQAGSTSVATVSPAGSTPSAAATVSRVATGTTTVQVSASYKGVTAVPVSRSVNVVGLTVKESGTPLTGDLAVARDSSSKMLTAELSACPTALTPADTAWSWTLTGSSVTAAAGSSGASRTLTPAAGGKTQVTVQVPVGSKTLEKAVNVYVFDLSLSGAGFSGPDASGNYTLVTSTSATSGVGVTASIDGDGMPSVSYSWTPGSGADSYIELNGSANAVRTVKPKAAGSASFTVGVEYGGTTVTSRTVNVSVAGIVFTTCSKSYGLGGATDNYGLVAEVVGYSGTPDHWTWTSGTPAVASVGTPGSSGTSGSTVIMTALSGGKTKITVTADVGGVTLSAEKEVYILQLTLNCGDGSFTPPSGIADPTYKLMLVSGDTAGTNVTANLAGLPEAGVSYTWTPLTGTSTKLNVTASGTGNKTARLDPLAAGSETVSVQATYDGESITKSINVTVAGITLTGGSTLEYDSDPSAANTLPLTASLVSIPAAALTPAGITFESSDDTIATVASDGTVTALKGGTVTITASATITANGKVLTATKDITVINLIVTNGTGVAVPATGNTLVTGGTATLTAAFEGLTGGDFAWTVSPAGKVSLTPADEASTTVSGVDQGSATVTLSASYGTTSCSKTLEFSVGIDISGLRDYLQALKDAGTVGTADTPIVLPPIVADSSNWTNIETRLSSSPGKDVYLDLSATMLPSITNLTDAFKNCMKLVVSPQLPSGIGIMTTCFEGCSSLTTAPVIPASVTNMHGCFWNCFSLTTAPDLSACTNLTNMQSCFYGCTSLTDLSGMTIPASVTNMRGCFSGCSQLTTAPVIPAGVTEMRYCFSYCTNLTGIVTVNASITDATYWENAFLNVTGVTVKVPDCDTKAAIEGASGNSGVTVELISGGSCD